MSIITASEILVIIDDGHGLETLGKRTPAFADGTVIKENEFNHATKVLLKQELEKQGFHVYDVSPERTDTKLITRTNRANAQMKANKYKKYIFISIHFNAIGSYWNDNVGGIETYHYPTSTEGKKLAQFIHYELLQGTDLKDRKVKSANFHVLRESDMYAVLLELGFMSNHIEANLMRNVSYQKECATEITKGVCNYFKIDYKDSNYTLDSLVKKISPVYYETWLDVMNQHSSLNWEGFLKSALQKQL